MLRRLFPLKTWSPKYAFIQKCFQPGRSLWTSSRIHQRYRYVRFGDPPPDPSGGGGGSSFFQSFWNRLSPGQRFLFVAVGGGAPVFYVSHLETVEETGRRRFIFMSKSMEERMGTMVHLHGIISLTCG